MKSKSIVNLYVVQKGDTIESIINKFNMSKELFYRYNPMTKYNPLVENQPLHILQFYQEQIVEMDLENEKIPLALTSIAHLYKEGFASLIYFPENFEIVRRNLLYQNTILINEFTDVSEVAKSELISILEEISTKLFNVLPILKEKNQNKLEDFKKELKELNNKFNNYVGTLDSNLNIDLLKNTFTDISSLILRIGMNMLIKDFNTVDIVFNELLNKAEFLNKLGILK
jgi:LysM repeat protein